MDFQRYNDGVGLIAQNKFQSAIPTCPLCSERVDWELAFDFSGNLICVLAKCPNCGGIIKTIFDFTNEPISTFSVSQIGTQNVSNLIEKTKYYVATPNQFSGAGANSYYGGAQQNNTCNSQPEKKDDSDAVGWGFLGFFFPIVGFILWLVWKNEYPKRARGAGIGCLVSVIISTVGVMLYVFIIILAIGGGYVAASLSAVATLLLPI